VQARAKAAVEADVDLFVVAAWLVLLLTAIVARYGTQLLA
jgi:hypothetical protein